LKRILLKTLDKKKLHTDGAKGNNYPEPDVPVQEAWNSMKELLSQAPASHSGFKSRLPKGAAKLVIGSGAAVIAAIITFIVTTKEQLSPALKVTYKSDRYPAIDTLSDGTIAFLDTSSTIAVTTPAAEGKQITIGNGGCYFRQLNKNATAPWQLKAGPVFIFPSNANIYVSIDTTAAVTVVQLQTGSAEVQMGEEKLHIAAGESVRFNTKKDLLPNRQKVNPNSFSYANRVFEFSSTPFKEAVGYIEKAYGVQIILKGNFDHCTITTRFDNKSLTEILDILGYTLAFDYTIDEKNKQVLISGDGCN
jgi:ferric-dicitrate binding protein FerR (iron transport regulator)